MAMSTVKVHLTNKSPSDYFPGVERRTTYAPGFGIITVTAQNGTSVQQLITLIQEKLTAKYPGKRPKEDKLWAVDERFQPR